MVLPLLCGGRKRKSGTESKKFIAKADNITLGELLDIWAEEELMVGTLSNGTVENYLGAICCIKKHPIADRKQKTVTYIFFELINKKFSADETFYSTIYV